MTTPPPFPRRLRRAAVKGPGLPGPFLLGDGLGLSGLRETGQPDAGMAAYPATSGAMAPGAGGPVGVSPCLLQTDGGEPTESRARRPARSHAAGTAFHGVNQLNHPIARACHGSTAEPVGVRANAASPDVRRRRTAADGVVTGPPGPAHAGLNQLTHRAAPNSGTRCASAAGLIPNQLTQRADVATTSAASPQDLGRLNQLTHRAPTARACASFAACRWAAETGDRSSTSRGMPSDARGTLLATALPGCGRRSRLARRISTPAPRSHLGGEPTGSRHPVHSMPEVAMT